MNNKTWIAVSFYTKGSVYEEIIKELIESAEKFNIELKVYEYESKGSWNLNCNMKPEVLLRGMNEFPDRNVVFIDGDAVFMKYPKLFDNYEYDLGCLWMYHAKSGKIILSAGTIFAKNLPEVRECIHNWNEHMIKYPNSAEQPEFEYFYKNNDLNTASTLPPEYCMVCLDEEPIDKNIPYNNVVIRHGRSSPKMKKGVK